MSDRTFKVDNPPMRGSDVREWQDWLQSSFNRWNIRYPVPDHGVYDVRTRAATASMVMALGLASAEQAMADGVTPELRTKLRQRRFTAAERKRFRQRVSYRRDLRERFEAGGHVHTPVSRILTDAWGWHPPVHDGIDLICPANATLFAICDGEVIRADTGGWWGQGAPSDPDLKAKGDGIIVIRCSTGVGPFSKGLNMCYGHAEAPQVQVGERVRAGDVIGKAGFANAWHVHFMVNRRDDAKGLGDRDPRPFTDYARSHS